jgi:sulfide:quinone oxidoreductase
MQITQIDALTYVGAQIAVADIEDLCRLKVGTIVVARPEYETKDQPTIAAISEAAHAVGINVHQIPVVPGSITDDDVRAYGAIMSGTDKPVLAYCRSGMRATSLWALNAAMQGLAPNDVLHAARNANFDLSALAPRLADYAVEFKTQ